MLLPFVLMSLTLSIDALGIGIAYSIRGVKITTIAKLVIGMISMVLMRGSSLLGTYLSKRFPEQITQYIGIIILVIMGVSFIWKSIKKPKKETFDFDHSSTIEGIEGIVLGIALSADSISAGVAATTLGISGIALSISVGVLQILFLYIGNLLVVKLKNVKQLNEKICGLTSGIIFLGMAFVRFIT